MISLKYEDYPKVHGKIKLRDKFGCKMFIVFRKIIFHEIFEDPWSIFENITLIQKFSLMPGRFQCFQQLPFCTSLFM